jgi:hypothetical protein
LLFLNIPELATAVPVILPPIIAAKAAMARAIFVGSANPIDAPAAVATAVAPVAADMPATLAALTAKY